ncbi:serine hydrolase domain-containing protein [Ureibacillus sinduriensis]|uniref:Beta-lactamase n=1 Tax=Ureibacillus sinduriensis BLB-1 = JCM 15800 TaxID=1384057 RepID=A0A0A3HZE6_9BACL|nr:serine hydrolase [Ureibacillus sinduriensis]KGR77961.1 beta-lactamase [Ureibacillus sinduriensis BLB-1 = JCM 15800]
MNNNPLSNLEHLIKKDYSNTAGIVIRKDGHLIYEKYFDGYSKDDVLHVASVTKSIISVLIGIAIDKEFIKNIEQKVLEYFPNYQVRRGEKTIQNVTLKNLMNMTAPYKYKSEPYTKIYSSDDWVKATLDLLGGKSRIGEFKYSTVGTQILSGVLTNATGQSIIEFANENLFKPLEIKTPHNAFIENKEAYFAFLKDKYVTGWVADPKGVNTAGWGLTLTPHDMAKIGQLYLNEGLWNGHQILSTTWVQESTKEQSRWGELPYGYLWWIIDDCYAALGDGGNVIFINPTKNMIVTIASRFMPRAKDRIELIQKHIIPLFT